MNPEEVIMEIEQALMEMAPRLAKICRVSAYIDELGDFYRMTIPFNINGTVIESSVQFSIVPVNDLRNFLRSKLYGLLSKTLRQYMMENIK